MNPQPNPNPNPNPNPKPNPNYRHAKGISWEDVHLGIVATYYIRNQTREKINGTAHAFLKQCFDTLLPTIMWVWQQRSEFTKALLTHVTPTSELVAAGPDAILKFNPSGQKVFKEGTSSTKILWHSACGENCCKGD